MDEWRLHSIRLSYKCLLSEKVRLSLDGRRMVSAAGLSAVWCVELEHLMSSVQRDLLKDLHGLNPVEVICGIRWRCFLLAVWHLGLKQQSFVVSWLNLSFQGDPNGWLKSWWFDIMRFAFILTLACRLRLQRSSREGSVLLMKWETNLHVAFEWERCILEHIYLIVFSEHTTWQFNNCFVLNYAVQNKSKYHAKCQNKSCLDSPCLVLIHRAYLHIHKRNTHPQVCYYNHLVKLNYIIWILWISYIEFL